MKTEKINYINKCKTTLSSLLFCCIFAIVALLSNISNYACAAGTLTPKGSPDQPIKIQDHHVNIVINNGFAMTEAIQTFFNPNPADLEAVYSMPVPKSASLSEFTIYAGEQELNGEVLPRNKANEIYEEEKSSGNDAGVANKNSYQNFEFKVYPVKAQSETRIRFVYYQPLKIDTGIGKYVYPLEEGGTDDVGKSFWIPNSKVENTFSATIEIRMAYPIGTVRVPGFDNALKVEEATEQYKKLSLSSVDSDLNRDLIVYYSLAENLPGRVEVISYRSDKNKPGTFMAVVTPGIDLQPITGGADYTFILDVSGSMAGKLHTLTAGVSKAIGEMRTGDRFRVVTFNDYAGFLTRDWIDASSDNINSTLSLIDNLRSSGGTNVYAGLELGLKDLNADRVSSVILVTDGVTNRGIVNPDEFTKLLKQYDIRVFGFLLGNSANWPLMRVISESSGGFYSAVSNADDILGQILLAKSKITHEALHDARLSIKGVKVFDVTNQDFGKIYRGEQLVLLGRYEDTGQAALKLEASLSGQDKVYKTTFEFPEIDTDYPELERLWAMDRIEDIEHQLNLGAIPDSEGSQAIEDLGVQYQLVTDETSMVVLTDEAFIRHKIERRNQVRSSYERQAQSRRYTQPIRNHRVDNSKPMFRGKSSHIFSGGGGGAVSPFFGIFSLILSCLGLSAAKRRKSDS
jgi:Ca-activated chloride channel homolog